MGLVLSDQSGDGGAGGHNEAGSSSASRRPKEFGKDIFWWFLGSYMHQVSSEYLKLLLEEASTKLSTSRERLERFRVALERTTTPNTSPEESQGAGTQTNN